MDTPLRSEGLNRRLYPFFGLGIVALVSFQGTQVVIRSPALLLALLLGALVTLLPFTPLKIKTPNRVVDGVPVGLGFSLALYPLWSGGDAVGIVASAALVALTFSPWLVNWVRVPRYVHPIAPFGGLIIGFMLELQFDVKVGMAFLIVFMPVVLLVPVEVEHPLPVVPWTHCFHIRLVKLWVTVPSPFVPSPLSPQV